MTAPQSEIYSRPPAALSPMAFLLAFAAAAVFAVTSRYPGYVHHDTAEIAMWSTLGWPAGLPKHPPFLPWLFRAYSTILPLNWVTLSMLTAANIVLGAWAAWQIARTVLDERRAALAALLYGLAPAGTFLALKLNHNAILVSLWPLTILAFLKSMDATSLRASALWGLAFGAVAAMGVLAKYYSGVLLAACLIAAILSPDFGSFLKRPAGYVAVIAFALLLTPHALWMLRDSGGDTLEYALRETGADEHLTGHFLIVTPLYLVPPLLAFLLLRRWIGPAMPGSFDCRRTRELVVLAAAPFLITGLMIAVFKLRGATSWSLPDFCVVPVLMAAALAVPSPEAIARLKRIAARLLAGVAVLGPIWLLATFWGGDANTVEPRAEVAMRAGRIFERVTGHTPTLVAGDPQSATSAFLALPSHPQVFTMFSPALAPWVTPGRLDREGLLYICRPHTDCEDRAETVKAGRITLTCRVTMSRRWLGLQGRPMTVVAGVILPKGQVLSEYAAATGCRAGEVDPNPR